MKIINGYNCYMCFYIWEKSHPFVYDSECPMCETRNCADSYELNVNYLKCELEALIPNSKIKLMLVRGKKIWISGNESTYKDGIPFIKHNNEINSNIAEYLSEFCKNEDLEWKCLGSGGTIQIN